MMELGDIVNQVNLWGKPAPTTEYLHWARGYYGDMYPWQRWWAISQLKPNQREQVWQGEKQLERSYTPAEICMQYNLKFEPSDISKVPQWRYQIGHFINLMENLNQDNSDYENYHVIDGLLLSKSI
jgi:hypothetical protein